MRPLYRAALISVAAIVLAHLADRWAFFHLATNGVYDHDLGRMLRTVGYLPIWWLVALGIGLQTRRRFEAFRLGLIPTFAALWCEVLKMAIRRERPRPHHGAYYFRPLHVRPFYTGDLGLPSSHAMVAFSGAWVLCRLYPRGWPVWLGLAAACGVTRVMAEAHFLSDVTAAAITAYFVVEVLWRRPSTAA